MKGKFKMIFIIILIIVILMLLYVRFIATLGFVGKEYGIYSDKLPSNFNGFKIAHLSDIHYATVGEKDLTNIVNEINAMKPDIIVFTGDLYDEFAILTDETKTGLINVLKKLEAPLGKYAISGNHDYSREDFQDIISEAGFIYLKNDSRFIYYNGDNPIEIVGYPSMLKDEPNYDLEVSNNYKIALIHEGDAADKLVDKEFDLILAGHSHGGQVRFPLIGVIKMSLPVGSKKYYNEHYSINKSELYISSGIGESKYKLRWFNKRSFNFYRLYSNRNDN